MVRLTSRERSCSRSQTDRIASRQPAAQRAPGARGRAVVFRHACKMGLEGIVSKRLGSPYRSGRSPDFGRTGGEARGRGGLVRKIKVQLPDALGADGCLSGTNSSTYGWIEVGK